MKYLFFFLLFFVGCTTKQSTTVEPVEVITQVDTHSCPKPEVIERPVYVKVVDSAKYDSLVSIIKKKNDSLFVERYRLERVKFYNNIVRKNKTQLKFLSGWISRAVQ